MMIALDVLTLCFMPPQIKLTNLSFCAGYLCGKNTKCIIASAVAQKPVYSPIQFHRCCEGFNLGDALRRLIAIRLPFGGLPARQVQTQNLGFSAEVFRCTVCLVGC